MNRRTSVFATVHVLVVGIVVYWAPGTAVEPTRAASDPPAVHAVLDDVQIELKDVARHHCHDRNWPLIRCFESSNERDLNLLDEPVRDRGIQGALSAARIDPYVRWYANSGYGGSSFVAYVSYTNLGNIGWNDAISSFTTYSGGHPRWSQDAGYGPPSWDWGSLSISYVGDAANDRFSSVERL